MPMKRKAPSVDVASGSDGNGDDELSLPIESSVPDEIDESTHDGFFDSDDSFCIGHQSLDEALYLEYMEERSKLKLLKRKLLMSLNDNVKVKCDGRPQVGFSKFSVSTFSNVISSLSDDRKDVIRKYGFGSLLHFDNCSVPKNFVHWVARLVNYNSGDIVIGGKVISLTKESVHMVLDLPFGGAPFPADFSSGQSFLLSRFGKDTVPPISFFSDSLTSKREMCDDDMFICFIVVAMSTFLCPNSSTVPCPKFFGIFEDLSKIRSYDWCGYILGCLLDFIKVFNQLKSCKSTQHSTLGGCVYYLAVLYLDHVDFGSHQVASTIPRICVWKQDMIKQYAILDSRVEGCFGCHPIMDYSRTCYAKDMSLLPQILHNFVDDEFRSKLDSYAHCKLPNELKDAIVKLIEKHCMNCGLSVNFDVNAISALSDEMRLTFIKLWKHVYSVSEVSQVLVLEVIRLLSESVDKDDQFGSFGGVREQSTILSDGGPRGAGIHGASPRGSVFPDDAPSGSGVKCKSKMNGDIEFVHPSQYKFQLNQNDASKINSNAGFYKLREISHCDAAPSSPNLVPNYRTALGDISNSKSLRKACLKNSKSVGPSNSPVLEVVDLENANLYVPDSISPSSMPGFTRYVSHKGSGSAKRSGIAMRFRKPGLPTDRDAFVMQALDFSESSHSPRGASCVLKTHTPVGTLPSSKNPIKAHFSGGSLPSSSKNQVKISPEVRVLGEKSFVDSIGEMTKKSNAIYNSQMDIQGCSRTRHISNSHVSLPSYAHLSQSFQNKSQDLTTGGKIPLDAPRRFANPGHVFRGDYELPKSKFYQVSKSEVDNYKILCKLAYSEFQSEDVVSLSGVRCTFWSLGQSLKPGGFVNSYVVSCFCYSLFSKPNGHPDQSKRHYFFSNIGENLLLDYDYADQDLLKRSFTRAGKASPLYKSNMIFFPIFREDHWFVFLVDIKDHHFIFLDSLYDGNSKFHQDIKDTLMNSFQYYWKKFVKVDMDFNTFGYAYPDVPSQPFEDICDSGIYAMMFLDLWTSPRDILRNKFSHEDIPSIRIKIANDLFFHHRNTGVKNRLYDFKAED